MNETEVKTKLSKHSVARTIKIGQRFGEWTVLGYHSIVSGKTRWLCQCKCGKESAVLQQTLIKGSSLSCGCDKDHHGHTRNNPEYASWQCMRSRCLNPNNTNYYLYGGRGIKICDRWMRYSNFLSDMGRAPKGKNTIDRVNPDGNYEPSNCRWASIKEQLRNRRNTIRVEFNGQIKSLSDWCDELGLEYNIIHHRQRFGRKISFQEQFNNHLHGRNSN